LKIINNKGNKSWNEIAEEFNARMKSKRNGKQCRERWFNFLNPAIKRDPFAL
jgi:hypothetical protein